MDDVHPARAGHPAGIGHREGVGHSARVGGAARIEGAVTSLAARQASRRGPVISRFFVWVSWLLLVLVLAAFAPTFYLRAQFDLPRLSALLVIHGVALTAWFVLLAAQATLIAMGCVPAHRKWGLIGAGVGILAALTAGAVNIGFAARVTSGSAVLPPRAFAGMSGLIWGNFSLLACFSAFLAAAIVCRRRAEVHKRLMLLASISLIAPALARIARWPIFPGEQSAFVPLALLALFAILPAYDLIAKRRIYLTTLVGTVSFLLVSFGARAFGMSAAGQSLLQVFS